MPRTARIDFGAIANTANLPRDPASVRARLIWLGRVLDGAVVIPGTQRRFGLDAVIGLIPVVGDLASAALGSYIIWEARNVGVPKLTLARMAANVGLDTVVGMIPLAGDVFDFLFRAHAKNVALVLRHLDRHHPSSVVVQGEATLLDRPGG
jgi:hypothetical protein